MKLKPRLPGLKLIVVLDPLESGDVRLAPRNENLLNTMADGLGVKIYSLDGGGGTRRDAGSTVSSTTTRGHHHNQLHLGHYGKSEREYN